jgi:hypothetical protein
MAFLSVRPHRGKVSGKAPCVERAPLPRPDLLRRAFPQKPSARQALAVLIVAGARDIYLLHSKKRLMLL